MDGRRSVAAVPCPACGHGYSRAMYGSFKDGTYTRRRVCQNAKCDYGFMTYEVPARTEPRKRASRTKETAK